MRCECDKAKEIAPHYTTVESRAPVSQQRFINHSSTNSVPGLQGMTGQDTACAVPCAGLEKSQEAPARLM
jgi:hypothetical protein